MVFRGGWSLILNLGNLNTVEYVIVKNIKSYERFREQAAYLNGEDGARRRRPRRRMPTTTRPGGWISTSSIVAETESP